ncbi:MAG: hypothetical protein SVZ03_10950 [Spirochaetota bacterium]|nr:hypothetical protein [Spirochaetota bacterium]
MKYILTIIIFLFAMNILPQNIFAQGEPNNKSSLSSSFSQAKFVPDISFILDSSIVYRDRKDEKFDLLAIPEFTHAHDNGDEHEHSHAPMHAHRGFNLNYGELALYSAVDPYFELFATFHLSTESFEIEEGFINTTSLPAGFQLKIGKFLSGFGRLNGQHAHYWDFADQPVVYAAFTGDHGILEKGAQASWIAPIDLYLLIGAEYLQGENEKSFGYDGFSNNAIEIETSKRPNLYTEFIKTSMDIKELTLLVGISGAHGKARINHDLGDDSGHALYGDTNLIGGDVTIKYLIDSYRYLSLQGEYLYRKIKGELYEANTTDTSTSEIEKEQSGFYAQLIIKPFLLWRIGSRYEMLHLNENKINYVKTDLPDKLCKYSAMIEYNPTEFSRIRLQYNHDRTKYLDEKNKHINEVILQFNMSIGAHGAHSF